MGENSKIQWTDHTFNPWIGCSKVSAGCANCYAEELMDKRYHKAQWGPNGTRVPTSEANWREPLKWNREAERDGIRRRVFCASLADVFEEWEELEPWRANLFGLIDRTPWLDWLLLTKRPENIHLGSVRRNVWLGTSVENQEAADMRVPLLLESPAVVHFLSMEPLLEDVNLHAWLCAYGCIDHPEQRLSSVCEPSDAIDWIIVGGESGNGARLFHVDWAYSILGQCRAAGVRCFIKQLGSYRAGLQALSGLTIYDKKGGDWSEWPEDLRVREFPALQSVV